MEFQRWSRGCGSGIGLSGHKNQYRLGVGIDNWVEDFQAKEDTQGGKSMYGKHIPFSEYGSSTTMKASFTSEGKLGEDIIPERKDVAGWVQPVSQENLFKHGPGLHSSYFVTLNELAYNNPAKIFKQPESKKVNECIWTGSKALDRAVPMTGNRENSLTMTKTAGKSTSQDKSYTTESKGAFSKTAELALGTRTKRDPILRVAEGGQKPQVGRKCKGACSTSCDSTYHKIGLRK
ncbi:hypothetical protein HOP50_07g48920 [Chloropicon primus]|uniref:Uncharacterized protein n=1 Tax=Chloropicon primus TaxID=1764295 RepID=A0A5B8MPE1_9CHLO|nr:hypothetical protein A3770_07p48710 [Chloropicon primus]UPR01570.1 hypothetical protein HOP50_07g48920 [Chloropicon primus]|eukprot:QDZ22353.1 hypothetical protein A3770_07p48710 [Chloropicon primus]